MRTRSCGWHGSHLGQPTVGVDIGWPCGHSALDNPTCIAHLDHLLARSGKPDVPAKCPACGVHGVARVIATHDLAGATGGKSVTGGDNLKWFDDYAPQDAQLREIVNAALEATKPKTDWWASGGLAECRDALSRWFTAMIPSQFDPSRDRAAVDEQANLLVNIEGTGHYVREYTEPTVVGGYAPDEPTRQARLRGIELYAKAFAAVAAQHGMTRQITVYRALTQPMRSTTRLQCVSWNPAHMNSTCAQWLYQAEIDPAAVAGISVGRELHPVVCLPSENWRLISVPLHAVPADPGSVGY